MITFLKTLAAVLAIAMPAVLTVDILGYDVPAAFGAGVTFPTFVVVLMMLTFASDYRSRKPLSLVQADVVASAARSELRLAA